MSSIAQLISPINLPSLQSKSPISTSSVSQLAAQSTPNPYNSRPDGFVTTTLFGGLKGKDMGQIVFGNDPDAATNPLKQTMLRDTGINMGVGAAIYGSLSVIKQGIGLASGKQDAAGAAANITTDLMRGGASGLGASVGGGLTGFAMKALGSTGTLGTVVTFIGGMIGASIGANLLESSGIRNTLVEKFGSKKAQIITNPTAIQAA